jgi:hypothetical protein
LKRSFSFINNNNQLYLDNRLSMYIKQNQTDSNIKQLSEKELKEKIMQTIVDMYDNNIKFSQL